ncbi:Flagellar hook-length control protein FliK [Minicystis rosea]|nr:Flagellar hook-length control protein FliK [Minicystis rosea]
MKVKRRFASILVACVVAMTAHLAHAETPAEERHGTIAVIAGPADRFGQRMVAELESLGFATVRLDPKDEPATRASLEAAARASGALAAIRAVPSARGVEVWVADRVTGKTVLREIASDASAPEADAALAIHTVELLRASLLEVSLPVPSRGEIAAPRDLPEKLSLPTPAAPAPPAPATLRFSIGPGVLASPGGFGPAAALDVGLSWLPSDRVGGFAFASIPLTRPRVSGVAGSADLSTTMLGAGMRFLFTTRASTWAPSVDVGVAAVALSLSGTASVAGTAANDASAWTAAPFVRTGLAVALTPMLRARADVLVGVVTQDVSIQLAKEDVATFGRPLVLASVGVDFGWF